MAQVGGCRAGWGGEGETQPAGRGHRRRDGAGRGCRSRVEQRGEVVRSGGGRMNGDRSGGRRRAQERRMSESAGAVRRSMPEGAGQERRTVEVADSQQESGEMASRTLGLRGFSKTG